MGARRINPNPLSQYLSYTRQELSSKLGVTYGTIQNWEKAGLPALGGSPRLYHGAAVIAFLKARNTSRKRKCPDGMLYCIPCRDFREPAGGLVEFHHSPPRPGYLEAICPNCHRIMRRLARRDRLAAIMPNIDIQFGASQ